MQTCRVRVRVPVRVHVPTNWSRLGDDVKVILASCGIQHVGICLTSKDQNRWRRQKKLIPHTQDLPSSYNKSITYI